MIAADFDRGQAVVWRELYGDARDKYIPIDKDWSTEWYKLEYLVRKTLVRARIRADTLGTSFMEALRMLSLRTDAEGNLTDTARCAAALRNMMQADAELGSAIEDMTGWAVDNYQAGEAV
jgi:hypothetical protein